jgi:hypothetical protein
MKILELAFKRLNKQANIPICNWAAEEIKRIQIKKPSNIVLNINVLSLLPTFESPIYLRCIICNIDMNKSLLSNVGHLILPV